MVTARIKSGSLTRGSLAYPINEEGVASGSIVSERERNNKDGHYLRHYTQMEQSMLSYLRSNTSDALYLDQKKLGGTFNDNLAQVFPKAVKESRLQQWGYFQSYNSNEGNNILTRISPADPVYGVDYGTDPIRLVDRVEPGTQIYLENELGIMVFTVLRAVEPGESNFHVSFDGRSSTMSSISSARYGEYDTGIYYGSLKSGILQSNGRLQTFLNHEIEKRDLGQVSFYENNVFFEDLDDLDSYPEIVITSPPERAFIPETYVDARTPENNDGVLQPFDVRTKMDLASSEVPFFRRGVRGSLVHEDAFRRNSQVTLGYNTSEPTAVPYLDAIEYFSIGNFENTHQEYDLTASTLYNSNGELIYENGEYLYALYHFDKDISTAGSLEDLTGNGRDLSPVVDPDDRPLAPVANTPGGNNLNFPQLSTEFDNDVLINSHQSNFIFNDGFTVSAWINLRQLIPSYGHHYFIAGYGYDNTAALNGWRFMATRTFTSSATRLWIQVNDKSGTTNAAASDLTLQANKWHHVVATHDGGTGLKMYVDGVLANNTGWTYFQNGFNEMAEIPNGRFSIGNYTDERNDSDFDGFISEVAVWSKEFTTTEAKNLYKLASNPTFSDITEGFHLFTVEIPPVFHEDKSKITPFTDVGDYSKIYFDEKEKIGIEVTTDVRNAIVSGTFGSFNTYDEEEYDVYGTRGADYIGGGTDSVAFGGLKK